MGKKYRFEVTYRLPNGNILRSRNTIASGVLEAKNVVKSRFPEAKIISCVKGQEWLDGHEREKKYLEKNKTSNTIAGALFGLAATAGLALGAKFLSDKKDEL